MEAEDSESNWNTIVSAEGYSLPVIHKTCFNAHFWGASSSVQWYDALLV